MDQLNDDVLILIMRLLDVKDLISLTLVCKRFHEIGLGAFLNRKIDFKGKSNNTQEVLASYLGNKHRALSIEILNLEQIYWMTSHILRNVLMRMTNLSSLFILGTQLSSQHLKEVLGSCLGLRHLSWTCDILSHQLAEAAALSSSFKNLKSLKIQIRTYLFPHNVLVNLLSECKDLEKFSIYLTVPPFLTVGERSLLMPKLSVPALPCLEQICVNVTYKDWFARPVVTSEATDFARACAQVGVKKLISNDTMKIAENGMKTFWIEGCVPISGTYHLFRDDYCLYYGTRTQAGCFCVTLGPPMNPANEHKIFNCRTLSLCLHTTCDHSYLPKHLSQLDNLRQLALTTHKYTVSVADPYQVIETEVQKRLNQSLTLLSQIEALELTYAHQEWLNGVADALKALKQLKRLCVSPCILVGEESSSTADQRTPESVSGSTPAKKRRVSLLAKPTHVSLLGEIGKSCAKLEMLEIMPSKHDLCCSVCKTNDFSGVCRDIAKITGLKHLSLESFTVSDGTFFAEVANNCRRLEFLRIKTLHPLPRCIYSDYLRAALPQFKSLKLLRWEQRNIGDPVKTLNSLAKVPTLSRIALIHKQELIPLKTLKPLLTLVEVNPILQALLCVFSNTTEKLCKDFTREMKEYRKRSDRQNLVCILRNTYDQGPDEAQYARAMPATLFDDLIADHSRVIIGPD